MTKTGGQHRKQADRVSDIRMGYNPPRLVHSRTPFALRTLLLTLGLFLSALPTAAAGTGAAPVLNLSEKGLGPITGQTPFNRATVQRLLPNWKVADGQGSTEGEPFPLLNISDREGLLATINADSGTGSIFSIIVWSNRVKNALGPVIGMRYSAIYPLGFPASCQAGAEEYGDKVFCLAPKSQHIHFVFKSSTDTSSYGRVPPESDLRSWTIQQIYWTP